MIKIFKKHYFKKYHLKYRHAKKLFALDVVLLNLTLILFTASIFFFFWKPGIDDKIDLTFSINKSRVLSGDYITIGLDYTNRNEIKLLSPVLSLRLPVGFILDKEKTPEIYFSNHSIFNLPNEIEPGADGHVEVSGWIWTEPKTEEQIIATLTYTPDGTDYTEQKNSSYLMNLPESVIKTNLQINPTSFPLAETNFKYTLENNSPQLVNLHLSSDDLKLNEEYVIIEPNQSKEIIGEYTTPTDPGNYALKIKNSIVLDSLQITQNSNEQTYQVIKPDLNIQAEVSDIKNISTNQTIPLNIKWQNNSSATLNNLKIVLSFEPNIIDLSKTNGILNHKIENNQIIIDQSSRTKLATAEAGESGTFNLNLKTKPNFNLTGENISLKIAPHIIIEDEGSSQKYTHTGESQSIPITTELTWTPGARYYMSTGDQLGRGPLPPRVGEETKYWIFVPIYNTSNAVEQIKFKATLNDGVFFTGKESLSIGENLKYNKNTNSLSWAQTKIPAQSQTGIYFEVATTPKSNDLGQEIILIKQLNFEATDSWTKEKIDLNISNISNELSSDDVGAKYGYLVK